jgi:hypothetical protein
VLACDYVVEKTFKTAPLVVNGVVPDGRVQEYVGVSTYPQDGD